MQHRWTQNDWSEEQIFEGKAKEYNVAYRFNKSHVRLAGKKSILFTIIAVVFVVAIIFSVVNLVASIITVFNFEEDSATCLLSQHNYYALEVASYTSAEIATSESQNCKKMGGAGYIYNQNNTYSILASVYLSSEDASSVLSKVMDTYPNVKVITLSANEIKYDYEVSQEDKEVLQLTLNVFDDIVVKLYNLYSSYDLKEIEYTAARLSLIEIKREFDEKYGVYKNVFSSSDDEKISNLNHSLNLLGDELTKLVDISLEENNFSPVLKHSTLSIVFIRVGL